MHDTGRVFMWLLIAWIILHTVNSLNIFWFASAVCTVRCSVWVQGNVVWGCWAAPDGWLSLQSLTQRPLLFWRQILRLCLGLLFSLFFFLVRFDFCGSGITRILSPQATLRPDVGRKGEAAVDEQAVEAGEDEDVLRCRSVPRGSGSCEEPELLPWDRTAFPKNHRIIRVGRDFRSSSNPSPLQCSSSAKL